MKRAKAMKLDSQIVRQMAFQIAKDKLWEKVRPEFDEYCREHDRLVSERDSSWIPNFFLAYPKFDPPKSRDPSKEEIDAEIEAAKLKLKSIKRPPISRRCSRCGFGEKTKKSVCEFEDETLYIASGRDSHYDPNEENKCECCSSCRGKCLTEMQDRRSMLLSIGGGW